MCVHNVNNNITYVLKQLDNNSKIPFCRYNNNTSSFPSCLLFIIFIYYFKSYYSISYESNDQSIILIFIIIFLFPQYIIDSLFICFFLYFIMGPGVGDRSLKGQKASGDNMLTNEYNTMEVHVLAKNHSVRM